MLGNLKVRGIKKIFLGNVEVHILFRSISNDSSQFGVATWSS